jgi:hypothetical protein
MNHNAAMDTFPSRLVLDGIPRIGFDIHLSPFPGSLYAVLEYLHDPQDYDYLMGVTGAAFRRLWNRDDGGNVDIWKLGHTPFRLAFDALGYAWHTLPTDKEGLISAVKASLAGGVPPISFGVFGPPEAGIVTGYDQDGAVLFGWSCFQPDRSHYYEKCDWFETMEKGGPIGWNWIVIDGKKPSPPPNRQVLVTALKWALDLECNSRRAETPDHICGLAAYDAWADGLEVDADFPPDHLNILGIRAMIHGDQCIMVEERRDAARFLRRMKTVVPQAADYLEDAAALYEQVGELVTPLWPWPAETNDIAMQALADPRQRRDLAKYIRTAREKETRAVACLEKALAVIP